MVGTVYMGISVRSCLKCWRSKCFSFFHSTLLCFLCFGACIGIYMGGSNKACNDERGPTGLWLLIPYRLMTLLLALLAFMRAHWVA
ncbi:hypothetical protein QBC41DRAFT_11588 [Cercophora samala]|uniref:Uncharacterized protein n=1 Tax=Cercophora samala TaxID=330535 RepID=A0AA39Z875_9PEZI|nr:hypothetical protein QBC41DRAFT_11588 [Cercophora samala]